MTHTTSSSDLYSKDNRCENVKDNIVRTQKARCRRKRRQGAGRPEPDSRSVTEIKYVLIRHCLGSIKIFSPAVLSCEDEKDLLLHRIALRRRHCYEKIEMEEQVVDLAI